MNPVMERRRIATQATSDRFATKPFKLGKNDCARMVVSHSRAIGRPIKALAAGTYHSPIGARRALKRLGHDTLAELLDTYFPRIPWSRALVGDIILLPADDLAHPDGHDIGSLAIAQGNGRALMYHPDAVGAVPAQVVEAITAWRVLPMPEGAE